MAPNARMESASALVDRWLSSIVLGHHWFARRLMISRLRAFVFVLPVSSEPNNSNRCPLLFYLSVSVWRL